MTRDLALEDDLLALGCEMAERVYNAPAAGFARMVKDRLALGEERFGDAWVTNPQMLEESRQEPPDYVAWMMLDLQRERGRMPAEQWETYRMSVAAVVAVGALADFVWGRAWAVRHGD